MNSWYGCHMYIDAFRRPNSHLIEGVCGNTFPLFFFRIGLPPPLCAAAKGDTFHAVRAL
jgi:hypothetical protein